MDAKITKARLNEHISYDWMKYVALLAGIIFLLSLIFTMASRGLTKGEQMDLYFVGNTFYSTYLNQLSEDLAGSRDEGGPYLSDKVLEVYAQSFNLDDSNYQQVFSTRLAAGEGDVFFSSYYYVTSYIDRGSTTSFMYCLGDLLGEIANYQTSGNEYDLPADLRQVDPDDPESLGLFQSYVGRTFSEEELPGAVEEENARRTRYVENLVWLNDWLTQNPAYAFRYARGTVYNQYLEESGSEEEPMEVEEEKIWGISMEPMMAELRARFLALPADADEEEDERVYQFAAAVIDFSSMNAPYFYEAFGVLCYLIDYFQAD